MIYHTRSSKSAQQRPIITAVEDITKTGQISTLITITQKSSTTNMLSVHTNQAITRITTTKTAARAMGGLLNQKERFQKERFQKKMHQEKRRMKRTRI